MTLCHNKLRETTGALLEEVCYDNAIEPVIQPVTGNNIVLSTASTNDGARLHVSVRRFWITGQKAFFDVRVFDLNTSRYKSRILEQSFTVNDLEKKRLNHLRILEAQDTSFTTLVFTLFGVMCIEIRTFISKLSELLAMKRD